MALRLNHTLEVLKVKMEEDKMPATVGAFIGRLVICTEREPADMVSA